MKKNEINIRPEEYFELFTKLKEQGYTKAQSIKEVLKQKKKEYISEEIDQKIIEKIAQDVYSMVSIKTDLNIYLTQEEVDHIKQIKKLEIQLLFLGFVVLGRRNPHPSNWIKYDRKSIVKFADIKNEEKIVLPLINELSCAERIEFGVIGSKNPIQCFRIKDYDLNIKGTFPVNMQENGKEVLKRIKGD